MRPSAGRWSWSVPRPGSRTARVARSSRRGTLVRSPGPVRARWWCPGLRVVGTGRRWRPTCRASMPGPWSTTWRRATAGPAASAERLGASARISTVAPSGVNRAALSTRLAMTCSRRPASASTSGRLSGVSTATGRVVPCSRARATTSSSATGCRLTGSAPAWMRLMASRLEMTSDSRSADSSIVWSSPARSASLQCTSSWRRLEVAALMPASGVRRSWPTAASSPALNAVGLGERLGPGGLLGQFLTLPGPCREVSQGREQVPILPDELGAPGDELQATGGGSAQGRFAPSVARPPTPGGVRHSRSSWRSATASMREQRPDPPQDRGHATRRRSRPRRAPTAAGTRRSVARRPDVLGRRAPRRR